MTIVGAPSRRGRAWSIVAATGAAALAMLALWALAHVAAPPNPVAGDLSLADIVEAHQPDSHDGLEISVQGEVEEMIGRSAFVLSEGDGIRDIRILVLQPVRRWAVPMHADVQVSGTVRVWPEPEDEVRRAGVLVPRWQSAQWIGRPVLVADVVHPIDR